MIKKVVKEPLLHFVAAAILVFVYFALTDRGRDASDALIRVSKSQLTAKWQQTWRRPPTEDELDGLINQAIRDELLVRKALALELDKGDAVVRNRMIQKMQFLRDQQLETPGEDEIQRWFESNRERYLTHPRLSFEHDFLGQNVALEIAQQYAERKQSGQALPFTSEPLVNVASRFQRVESDQIARQFGKEFTGQLEQLDPGVWHAPVYSGFGAHAVRLRERIPAVPANLSTPSIRRRVENDYLANQRSIEEQRLITELRQQYSIEIVE